MSDDLTKREFLIFKVGRGWYRENSQGYTSFKFDAGRFTEEEAKDITHPNGPDGPRDGMFFRHESEVRDYPSDRIEELEAKLAEQIEWVKSLADDLIAAEGREARLKDKLAKAVQFTKGVIRHAGNSGDDYLAEQARTTLAELTGGKDE